MNHRAQNEISEHDSLVLMMANYFKSLGYSNIKADIVGWERPSPIWWSNNENVKYIPDLTCQDKQGRLIILEAETCTSLNTVHTHDQFNIFRAHATGNNGRFEVVVPRICNGGDGRALISQLASRWNINLDNIWTPSS